MSPKFSSSFAYLLLVLVTAASAITPGGGACSTAIWIDSATLQLGRDFSKQNAIDSAGLFLALIEIPTGTAQKWELDKNKPSRLVWERKDSVHRVVQYLGYPGNYGALAGTDMPRAQGGDGDALDVVVLGEPLPRGSWHWVRPIGIMSMLDNGEQDDKIIAVLPHRSPFGILRDFGQLDSLFPGIATIITTWFQHYKGAGNRVRIQGVGGSATAKKAIGSRALNTIAKEK